MSVFFPDVKMLLSAFRKSERWQPWYVSPEEPSLGVDGVVFQLAHLSGISFQRRLIYLRNSSSPTLTLEQDILDSEIDS